MAKKAKKSSNDYSGEILEFREVLSTVLSGRICELESEIRRIKRLSLMFPKEETHGLRVVGRIDLTQFDPTNKKKRERIKSGAASKVDVSEHTPEKKERGDSYKRFLLDCFIEEAEAVVDNARNYFIQSSSLQFAVMRKEISEKEISDWNLVMGECSYHALIKPYRGEILTLEEMSSFLVSAYLNDRDFTRELLTLLSLRYGTVEVLSAVCDNPFLKGDNINRKEAEVIIRDAIQRLGNSQVAFSKDIGVYETSLNNYLINAFDYYIPAAKKVTKKSLTGSEFPIHLEEYDSLNGILDAGIDARDELHGVLECLLGKGDITQGEYDAILGIEQGSTGYQNQEHHDSTDNKEQDRINDSPIACPEVFKGHPDALRRFYHQIYNEYILVDEDSFLYWFNSLRMDKGQVNRIVWLKGVTDDIKCFIEALYPLHDSYLPFMKVFVDKNGKELTTLGANALVYRSVASKRKKVSDLSYEGRQGRKTYDKQKKAIDEIKDLIKKALTEQ